MTQQVLNGRRPELPTTEEDAVDADGGPPNSCPKDNGGPTSTPALLPGTDLAQVPASLHALPQLNSIICACWQQKEHRRPSAAQAHNMLLALMRQYRLLRE
jgi:hypothetical protein